VGWRGLLVWVTLSFAAEPAVTGFWALSYEPALAAARRLAGSYPIPVASWIQAWLLSTWLFALTWFQPLLLRLALKGAVGWYAALLGPAVLAMLAWEPTFFPLLPAFLGAIMATVSPFLLRGQRTRPWMGVLGGAVFGGAMKLLLGKVGLPWLYLVPDVLFGTVLLLGTAPIGERLDGTTLMPHAPDTRA